MERMPQAYIEKIYAGWLGKIIGIRLGAAVESWTAEQIAELYGEIGGYPADYRTFAADDDSNGPIFFIRALETMRGGELAAQDVGEALLNYAPYEHGFFWWGGYGVSTEHTAYLNLRRGLRAPDSGSAQTNGRALAEQIGGQIFIDTWGLVAPGNPKLAAELAAKAASVTHGGNGVWGGVYVAACIAAAFDCANVRDVMETGLSLIPEDCAYALAVRDVMRFHFAHPENWRDGLRFVQREYGYDRYEGACHIIPNACVMALAMLYGGGDFEKTLLICNNCGWDTDCNAGNVGTVLGVLRGLEGIDFEKWRRPINDFLVCSSVMGSLNVQSIPQGADTVARLACRLAGKVPPKPFAEAWENETDCHFEYPGSTHGLLARTDGPYGNTARILNTDEDAHTGRRCLKLFENKMNAGQKTWLYRRTYCFRDEFDDSRYDPAFSPVLYPGQTVTGACRALRGYPRAYVCLYARDAHSGEEIRGEEALLDDAGWTELSLTLPRMEGALLSEAGFRFRLPDDAKGPVRMAVLADDLAFFGAANYSLDFAREREENWGPEKPWRTEVTQITRLKDAARLENGALRMECDDFGAWYTGNVAWRDYAAEFTVTPLEGEECLALFRVQGAIRSYAAALRKDGRFALLKNDNGYRVLSETKLDWRAGEKMTVRVRARGSAIEAECGGARLCYEDGERPWLSGAVGMAFRTPGRALWHGVSVTP